jgi:hypothetical protein
MVQHEDAKLKRQVCACLAQIAKHEVDLAEVVVEAEIFPSILRCLKDSDEIVAKNAATCIREVAKHTPEMAKLIINAGGAAALVDYVLKSSGNARLPAIMVRGVASRCMRARLPCLPCLRAFRRAGARVLRVHI